MYTCISLHILHDTLSITTCTTTASKYFGFMYNLLYMHTSLPMLHNTFSITTCTSTVCKYSVYLWIVLLSILRIYILFTSSMSPCPSLPAQPQSVSTLFSCTLYIHVYACTCTSIVDVYLSSHSP